MRFPWLAALLAALAASGCSARSSGGSDAGSPGFDANTRLDAGLDAGPRTCESDTDCDDDIACTADLCGVGGFCNNMPLDETCPEGQFCSTSRGCTEGCETDADCSDGVFCNGAELCVAGDCFDGDPADCDDGNACTTDTCDTDVDGCRYEVAEGCDAGVGTADAGPPPAFDPTMHYDGEFVVAPTQSLGCPPASYAVGAVTFDSSGSTLDVDADWMTLSQSTVPDGPSFDVTYVNGSCATYRLMGTFSDADNFTGTWTATMASGCGHCTDQTGSLVGVRR